MIRIGFIPQHVILSSQTPRPWADFNFILKSHQCCYFDRLYHWRQYFKPPSLWSNVRGKPLTTRLPQLTLTFLGY